MKRITLVIPTLTSGGAERVMTTLANFWAAEGRSVTLLTLDDGRQQPFYSLHPKVDLRALDVSGATNSALEAVRGNVRRILTLRRAIVRSNPEVVLSFLDTTNVQTLLATRGLGIPVVVEEHTDPSQKSIGLWDTLRARLYPRASAVVLLSDAAMSYFGSEVRKRGRVIPNPIVVEPDAAEPEERAGKRLVAMGRFGPEKGFDLLLDAFARIAPAHPDWDLVIWGDGPLRPQLETQRVKLELANRVEMPGRTSKPHDELRNADLFVMSSRREGFPMALGEAMACGLPAVSADCPSGPRLLIRDGVDGVLCRPEDATALAEALDRVMADDALRASLAARAPEVLERFGLERVMAIWDDLFDELIAESRREFRTKRSVRERLLRSSRGYDATTAPSREAS